MSDDDNDKDFDELSDNEYEVERVMDHRQDGSETEYLIKWKGYDNSFNTWEPEENILSATSLVKEYFANLKKSNGATEKSKDLPSSADQSPSPAFYSPEAITLSDSDSASDSTYGKKSASQLKRPRKPIQKTAKPFTKKTASRSPPPKKKRMETPEDSSESEDSDSGALINQKANSALLHESFTSLSDDTSFNDGYDRVKWRTGGKDVTVITDVNYAPKGDWESLVAKVACVFAPPPKSTEMIAVLQSNGMTTDIGSLAPGLDNMWLDWGLGAKSIAIVLLNITTR
ncbi:hypothetical protein [Absidia glauca]|uniref:Chromo domain-containing protein n=1 Tax=Absidia glauca TaxID=4829 RepID=A0A168R0Q4_ABSGL|nr:hypothetical protein [Absidia glauca]